jgi:uncharacterized protein YoaH (UPF0181 family)
MKSKERIMAILDEIEGLSSDRATEHIADALRNEKKINQGGIGITGCT